MVLTIKNLIRRVFAKSAKGDRWQIEGYETDDEIEGTADDAGVEAFSGPNIYVKPSGATEAIMVHVGGTAEHPVIVAARDEKARRAFVSTFGDISAGEYAVFNSAGNASILIKANGDIFVSSKGVTKLGQGAAGLSTITDGFVHGTSPDPLTGFPQWVIGNSTRNVVGKK